jgi:hypothetical protein
VTADDGTTVTITGGCTNSFGVEHVGTATIVRSGGDRMLTLDGYGSHADPEMAATTSGDFDLRETSATTHSFTVDFVHEGGIRTTVHYEGTVEGTYEGPTRWNGEGNVVREGLVAPTGTVYVRTEDEVLDGAVCNGQALSGRTRINTGDQSVVVEYDGATDCDDEDSARWYYNGEDRGLVDGIVCSAAGPGLGAGGSARMVLSMLLLLGIAVGIRRLRPSRSRSMPGRWA